MRLTRALAYISGLSSLTFVVGCDPVSLTLFGVGAGVSTSTAVSYSLNGIAYRTFTAPMPAVEQAVLSTLRQMGFEVKGQAPNEEGKLFKASGNEREIEIQLERVSDKTTRMRSVVSHGAFLKDRATATELILQTEKALDRSFAGRAGS